MSFTDVIMYQANENYNLGQASGVKIVLDKLEEMGLYELQKELKYEFTEILDKGTVMHYDSSSNEIYKTIGWN